MNFKDYSISRFRWRERTNWRKDWRGRERRFWKQLQLGTRRRMLSPAGSTGTPAHFISEYLFFWKSLISVHMLWNEINWVIKGNIFSEKGNVSSKFWLLTFHICMVCVYLCFSIIINIIIFEIFYNIMLTYYRDININILWDLYK